ncbi:MULTISPECIES: polysaccharide pyruvyl transferase family protein [Paenibacillus]|uniref:polysaccharide pyruvyl transferase family protein n=1 Tax=Paenibacillus TaxID=44249 RepID=UPI0022B8BCB8|nr:polysaccharide pyruvyl transferase family protein [Paenibacillus caseinilyticus]MCZ8518557.1 polysaccharide pyruvyl transferase family protein [Paenibacillus caseinilyticus]
MNICVCGYLGMGNFGDELFLKTFAQVLEGHRVFPWVAQVDVNRVDAVLIGGGDLITPYHFNSFYFPPQLENKPTWIYGVGIVDYYPEHTWPAEEVEKYRVRTAGAQSMALRDQRSADIAARLSLNGSIDVVPDVVFGYEPPGYPMGRFSARPTAGLCIFTYDAFPKDKLLEIAGHLIAKGYDLVFIPVVNQSNNTFADAGLCSELKEEILQRHPKAVVLVPRPQYDLEVTYSYLGSLDCLISFKLHPSLAAIRSGVPVFCLTQMSKVRSLMESFGLDDYVLDYTLPQETLMEKLDDFLANGRARLAAAAPRIRQTEELARRKLEELKASMEQRLLP